VVGVKDIEIVKNKLRSLSGTGKVLELGCGNGTYTECFTESASKIIATDISEGMLAITTDRFSDQEMVQVEKADCFNLPYNDSSFDTVFMVNLLHIIPNPKGALSECFRVLKDDGKLIISCFTVHGMRYIDKIMLRYRYAIKYGARPSTAITFTPKLAIDLVKSSGFKPIDSKLIGTKTKAVYLTASKTCNK